MSIHDGAWPWIPPKHTGPSTRELELAVHRNALEEIDTLISSMGSMDPHQVLKEIQAIVRTTLDPDYVG